MEFSIFDRKKKKAELTEQIEEIPGTNLMITRVSNKELGIYSVELACNLPLNQSARIMMLNTNNGIRTISVESLLETGDHMSKLSYYGEDGKKNQETLIRPKNNANISQFDYQEGMILKSSELPQQIDFESTVNHFQSMITSMDFSELPRLVSAVKS